MESFNLLKILLFVEVFLFLYLKFFKLLKILHMWGKSYIAKRVGCRLVYNIWWVNVLNHMVLGKSKPHQVCIHSKSTLITRGFVGPSLRMPRGCIHTSGPMGWLCDELSQPKISYIPNLYYAVEFFLICFNGPFV